MKFGRYAANTVATIAAWFGIAKIFGSINFSDAATNILVSAAALFGQYGDENIEDFYFLASALVALFLAILIVWTANVLLNRLTKKANPPAQNGRGNPSHGM
jgi:uncharacterized membrane protein